MDNIDVINALAGEIASESTEKKQIDLKMLTQKATELKELRKRIEKEEKALSKLTKAENNLAQEVIPGYMQEIGVTKFTLDGGEDISYKNDYRGSISKANMNTAKKILAERKLGGIFTRVIEIKFDCEEDTTNKEADKLCKILSNLNVEFSDKLSINAQTLKALIREQEKKGTPLPQKEFGVFKFFKTVIK